MRRHLNTLFVTLDDTHLKKDGAAVDVRHEKKSKIRIPLHNLDGIVTFGWNISLSPQLMAACSEEGVSISFHNPYGKFVASVNGTTSGNVFLRREQYRQSDSEEASVGIARNCIIAKVANCRHVLKRAIRDHGHHEDLDRVANYFSNRVQELEKADNLESIRGIEGDCAREYFGVFSLLIKDKPQKLEMDGRSRRPPRDPVNALLSFLYTLLMHDCRSACESVGLDPQVGFLHRDRPGRPSMALDLMEEFRPLLADRMVLNLLNRNQISLGDFDFKENDSVVLKEDSRKTVMAAYQERKNTEINHPFLNEKTTVGLLPQLQARLLARYLREDIDTYPAFIWN